MIDRNTFYINAETKIRINSNIFRIKYCPKKHKTKNHRQSCRKNKTSTNNNNNSTHSLFNRWIVWMFPTDFAFVYFIFGRYIYIYIVATFHFCNALDLRFVVCRNSHVIFKAAFFKFSFQFFSCNQCNRQANENKKKNNTNNFQITNTISLGSQQRSFSHIIFRVTISKTEKDILFFCSRFIWFTWIFYH